MNDGNLDTADELKDNSLSKEDLKNIKQIIDEAYKTYSKDHKEERSNDSKTALTTESLEKILNEYIYKKSEQDEKEHQAIEENVNNLKIVNENIQSVNNILFVDSILIVICLGAYLGDILLKKFTRN
jgi:hypothetical protein